MEIFLVMGWFLVAGIVQHEVYESQTTGLKGKIGEMEVRIDACESQREKYRRSFYKTRSRLNLCRAGVGK